jgi:Bardet-Biedl syndrome 9 protein
MKPEWHFTVGEHVHTILIARLSKGRAASQVDIVVLAERLLIYLKENGSVRSQKRLDYSACCCHAFVPAAGAGSSNGGGGGSGGGGTGGAGGAAGVVAAPAQEHLLVGSRTGALLIYRDMDLIWSARLSAPAAGLGFGSFGGQPGLIVCHGTDGGLRLCYLGMAQARGVGAAERKELNYEAMDAEHKRLLGEIRDASSQAKKEPTDGVTLWAQVQE